MAARDFALILVIFLESSAKEGFVRLPISPYYPAGHSNRVVRENRRVIPRELKRRRRSRHGREMSVDAKLREHVEQALAVVDDHGTAGPRLLEDAERLWGRVQHFIGMHLVHEGIDNEALELACYAMQLPTRRRSKSGAGKAAAKSTLRDRAEEAAELLVGIAGPDVDESLLDRATRILQEMPHRSPMLDEAKL